VNPVVEAGNDQTNVKEGDTVSFSGSYSDAGSADTPTILWEFGDESTVSETLTPTHVYADNGDYTVTFTVSDKDGGVGTDTLTVTVDNVNPVVEAGNDQTNVKEGDTVSFSGSYSDAGSADTPTILWDFGDESTVSETLTPTHVYADNGIYTVTFTVIDKDGGVGTDTLTVTVDNANPVVEAGDDQSVNEGNTVSFSGSYSDAGSADTPTILWDFGDESTVSETLTPTHVYADNGIYTVTFTVTDKDGGVGTDTLTVTVDNANPAVVAGDDHTNVKEGDTVSFSGSYSDAGTVDTHTIEWDFGDGTTISDALNPTHIYADNGVYTVTLTVTDDNGGVGTDTLTVTVNNVDPAVGEIKSPIDPVLVNTQIATSCTFTDAGTLDTHTAVWDWGDYRSSDGVVSEINGAWMVTGEHVYTEAGVYWVTLTVTDDDGGSSSVTTENYVVAYNPEGGFVTGGGWINSPENAYVEKPELVGKATFGFVSKYEKGATVPTGKTEFQFKVADLNFKSTSYDWLVIAGSKAKYKGTGTINGEGNYGFMLSAVDGDSIDKFRIKIWDKDNGDITVYDNEIDTGIEIEEDKEPSTVISGGSIVVHKEK
jgi:PKD repeat protein